VRTRAELRPYQARAIETGKSLPGCALFLDMGLGKTVIALSIILDLILSGEILAALVLGPIRVIESVWQQEAAEWEHLTGLKISLVRGTAAQRIAALSVPADIYLCNFELIDWLFHHLAGRFPFDLLAVDESSGFKAPGTVRFRVMRYAVRHFRRKLIMTGTPTPNTLMEIWPQIYLLDEGARLGTAFGRFQARFFYQEDYNGYKYALRPGAEEKILELIAPISIRLSREEFGNLPPVTYNKVKVKLPDSAMVMYREFERKMFLELDNTEEVEAVNAAVLTMKCMQIANGAVYTTPDPEQPEVRTVVVMHDAKLEALAEIVAETGSPVMVAYMFKHDLARLREWREAPFLGGDQEQSTEAILEAWNAKRLPLLYVHYKSASHGLNMQFGGHTLVCFGLTWSAEARAQLIARLDRSGQEFPVVVHDIIAENTVDEVTSVAVDRKLSGQAALLSALNDYRVTRELLG